jgi:hypothetical protein
VYDGNTNATLSAQDDRLSGDALALNFTAAFADRNVGTAKPVAINSITLSGTDASNYAVPAGATVTGTITQRALATWTATVSGNWSTASSWDALPDGNNVAAVAIPATAGLQVTYDLSSLNLASLSNAATLVVAGGGLKLGALTNTGSLVVANLLRPLLLDLARGGFAGRGPQVLVASGLLVREADEVSESLCRGLGMRETGRSGDGEWAALRLAVS